MIKFEDLKPGAIGNIVPKHIDEMRSDQQDLIVPATAAVKGHGPADLLARAEGAR